MAWKSSPESSDEIRSAFLDYFAERSHQIVSSSSLVPIGDPTLLFVNAGMVQFKDVFLGSERRPYIRATTSQKCVRAGGKHNDLDEVGHTARHHTFFEMLGNFSFGDYFKREAIGFAWEFVTDVVNLPKESLWATIFEDDQEAHLLWQEVAGMPAERIVRLGEKDNFWAMGDTGPCGPCSEIMLDRGVNLRCDAPECGIGKCDCDRWLEIWNLVFMQYDCDKNGKLTPLPQPSIDTGMGLERVASVVQNVASNWDTDLFRPIIRTVEELSGRPYESDGRGFSHRVIADHVRASTFLIGDGVLPSNEGRGYVLRRILRRAIRLGRTIGVERPFLGEISESVIQTMGRAYPELQQRREFILRAIEGEEDRFKGTLTHGMNELGALIDNVRKSGGDTLMGEDAFRLHDTFGFPKELTAELVAEAGLKLDESGFAKAMERQRGIARAASKFAEAGDGDSEELRSLEESSEFVGYDVDESESRIVAILADDRRVERASAGETITLVLQRTPFYAEAGGQIGDTGSVIGTRGRAEVLDTQRPIDGVIVHRARLIEGELVEGENVIAGIDSERRQRIRRHHSATHLLHRALRELLGQHVHQAGSLVAPDRLRFDFTHVAPVQPGQIAEIETVINRQIRLDRPVNAINTTYEDAIKSGAMALFGEKYGDAVRMLEIGDFSRELCGGTHVNRTGEIGNFLIRSETAVGSGVRRIEALAGDAADLFVRDRLSLLNQLTDQLGGQPLTRLQNIQDELNDLKRELERVQREQASSWVNKLASQAKSVDGLKVVAAKVDVGSFAEIRGLGDLLRDRLGESVLILAGSVDDRPGFVGMVSPSVRLHAGRLVNNVASIAGGRGGGRPDVAQAGGGDVTKIDEALAEVPKIVEKMLEREGRR